MYIHCYSINTHLNNKDMKKFKVFVNKPYEHTILANSADEARSIISRDYPQLVISDVVDCSTPAYQSAYDSEQFDSNGRRRF